MLDTHKIEKFLRDNLKEGRYKHSLGVRDTAVKLAKIYGADIEKASVAGLVHDCAKNLDDSHILELVMNENIEVSEICAKSPQIMHGLAGSIIAEKKFCIRDKDVLNAIAYHTTGRRNMSLLEKIIYIADYIEPGRVFDGVDELRMEVEKNLNNALIMAFNNTIKFVIKKGELLHPDTVEARNDLICKR